MKAAAAAQEFEQAAVERNRLAAVRSLLERQRVAGDRRRHAGRDRRRARRQRRQRPGASRFATACSRTASPSTSPTRPSATPAEVREEFMLQYYGRRDRDPGAAGRPAARLGSACAGRGARGAGAARAVEMRAAERGEKRRILELAERNATLRARPGAAAGGAPSPSGAPRRSTDCSGRSGCDVVADADRVLRHLEPRRAPTRSPRWSSSRAGAPKKSDYRTLQDPHRRRARRRLRLDGRGARPALRAAGSASPTPRPHDAELRPRASPALPNLIVIDGGKGQLSAGLEPLARLPRARRRGRSRSPSASRRSSCPGARAARAAALDTPELQLLAARPRRGPPLRDHPPPRAPRPGDDGSLLDELPGVGPARKRALLAHFGSPEAVARGQRASSSRRCPGCRPRSAASCTRTCTASASAGRGRATARARSQAAPSATAAACPLAVEATVRADGGRRAAGALQDLVDHHGLLRRRQVDGDERLRGRRLLLRRQPAAGMIGSLVELFVHEGSKVERAAVVSDVRGGEYFEALRPCSTISSALGLRHRVLFLDAAEQTLLTATRRPGGATRWRRSGTIADGRRGRARAARRRCAARADVVIDTTGMSAATLREQIAEAMLGRAGRGPAGGHLHELRLQARPAARRRPACSTCASCPTRTTSRRCAR